MMTHTNNLQRKKNNCALPIAVRNKFDELQNELNVHFKNNSLLYNAFTHSSYVNEHRRKNFTDNERLGIFR